MVRHRSGGWSRPPELRELARGGLQQASESGALSLSGDLGFAILHRCGESFYFLLVSTWGNDNELWETVAYLQDAYAGAV